MGVRVWVTRASPGAQTTAEHLRALGFEPVVAPLLEVRAIPGGPIDLTGVAALAFTSANGVAAFAARSAERVLLPVFTVGAATAGAARSAGFASVVSADGDVEALASRIAAHGPFAGAVLHPGPVEAAGDLIGALGELGVSAARVVVYETAVRPLSSAEATLIAGVDAVLLHSPKAARALADLIRATSAGRLTAICLSANVAAPVANIGLAAVLTAAEATEAALLETLVEARG